VHTFLFFSKWETSPLAASLAVRIPSNLLPHTDVVRRSLGVSVQSRNSQSYEPLLLENEREAVADLLQYLESTYLPRPRAKRPHPEPYPF
jgi:antitoxin component of MazEF toxin-antitoxin module